MRLDQPAGADGRGGNRGPLRHQGSIGGNAHGRMMMKAAPAAPLVVAETDLLFELEIIALDQPAQLGERPVDRSACRTATSTAKTWLAVLRRPASRSAAILRAAGRCAGRRREPGAPAGWRSAISRTRVASCSRPSARRRSKPFGQARTWRTAPRPHHGAAASAVGPGRTRPAPRAPCRVARPPSCRARPPRSPAPTPGHPPGNRCRCRSRHLPARRHPFWDRRRDPRQRDLRLAPEHSTSSGTPARDRSAASSAQLSGRYIRHATGRLAVAVATDNETATWQLSCLPNCPQYCRATPTECRPFLGKPVSSTIHACTGRVAASPSEPPRALPAAAPTRPSATGRRSGAATDARPRRSGRSVPHSAGHSYAPSATATPCSTSGTARPLSACPNARDSPARQGCSVLLA